MSTRLTTYFKQLYNHRMAVLVAALFFLLAVMYSSVTPIFESPDELWHYPFVWHLAQTASLPVQNPANPQLWQQEGSQPPLYYALTALLTVAIPADDLPNLIYPNPHADIGLVSPDGNANIVVHTDREHFPWRGATLALHVARLFSVLLGVGTVLTVYAISLALWPKNPVFALMSMTFVAFNPMFLFISGSVNNDTLIIFLAALVLWRLVILTMSKNPAIWQFILLGILTGLAALTKISGLGLAGLTGLTVLVWGIRHRSWKVALFYNGLIGVIAAAIAGWWYWRNYSLYGDWSGTENMVMMMGARPVTPTWQQLLSEVPGLFRSFWGLFGYFSVPMPVPIYWMLNVMLAIGLAGWLSLFINKERSKKIPPGLKKTWPILLGWIAIMLMGFYQWTLQTPATQGRLLFPALAAVAPLWAAGWMAIFSPCRWSIPALLMFLPAFGVPLQVIAPAYALPAPVKQLPASAQPLNTTLGDIATLQGYHIDQQTIRPGDSLPVTLYWRGKQPAQQDYSIFLHLVDQDNLIVTQRDVFHGPGVYPTSQWRSDTQFADTYVLRLPTTSYAPVNAQLVVGLYNYVTGERLPVVSGGDSVKFGNVQIEANPGQLPNPQRLQFDNGITLAGYSLDTRQPGPNQTATLTLYWQADKTPVENYKVFVHVVGENDTRVAQHDSEPQQGAAPTTSWVPGQIITDIHPLTIAIDAPAGAYKIFVGLYEGNSGQRLSLVKDGDNWVQGNAATLGNIRVIAP